MKQQTKRKIARGLINLRPILFSMISAIVVLTYVFVSLTLNQQGHMEKQICYLENIVHHHGTKFAEKHC